MKKFLLDNIIDNQKRKQEAANVVSKAKEQEKLHFDDEDSRMETLNNSVLENIEDVNKKGELIDKTVDWEHLDILYKKLDITEDEFKKIIKVLHNKDLEIYKGYIREILKKREELDNLRTKFSKEIDGFNKAEAISKEISEADKQIEVLKFRISIENNNRNSLELKIRNHRCRDEYTPEQLIAELSRWTEWETAYLKAQQQDAKIKNISFNLIKGHSVDNLLEQYAKYILESRKKYSDEKIRELLKKCSDMEAEKIEKEEIIDKIYEFTDTKEWTEFAKMEDLENGINELRKKLINSIDQQRKKAAHN